MNWMSRSGGSHGNRSDPSGASAADLTNDLQEFSEFAEFDVTFDNDDVFETTHSPSKNSGDIRFVPDPHGTSAAAQVSSVPSLIATPLPTIGGDTPSLTTTADDSDHSGDDHHHHHHRGGVSDDRPLESAEVLRRQVREAVERNALAWNMGDLSSYLDGYSEDVRYVNSSMFQERGIMTITTRRSLDMLFRGLFEQSRKTKAAVQNVETTIVDVKLMGREHAYVYGTYQHGRSEGVFSLTMVKENRQWLIQSKHASVKPARAQQQQLQQPMEGNGRSSSGSLRSSSGSLRSSVTSSPGAPAANRRFSAAQRSGAVR